MENTLMSRFLCITALFFCIPAARLPAVLELGPRGLLFSPYADPEGLLLEMLLIFLCALPLTLLPGKARTGLAATAVTLGCLLPVLLYVSRFTPPPGALADSWLSALFSLIIIERLLPLAIEVLTVISTVLLAAQAGMALSAFVQGRRRTAKDKAADTPL